MEHFGEEVDAINCWEKQLTVTITKILQTRKPNYSAIPTTIFTIDPVATAQTKVQAALIQEFIILLQC